MVRTRMGECWGDSDPEFSHVFVGVELERFSLDERSAAGSHEEVPDCDRVPIGRIVAEVALGQFERRDAVQLVADRWIGSVRDEMLDDADSGCSRPQRAESLDRRTRARPCGASEAVVVSSKERFQSLRP
jgi:hypothetical protein